MKKHHPFLHVALAMFTTATQSHAASHAIIQSGRVFKPATVDIAVGDILDIANRDEFIHQVYVVNGLSFDSAEQEPGNTIHITFPNSGTYEVRCHIHPKMLLTVRVK